ncbi:MAG: ATP-binding protein [Clostridiaceae bacterium]
MKTIIKSFFYIFKFVYIILKSTIQFLIKLINKFIDVFKRNLRFSLSFKLTFSYVFILSIFLLGISFLILFGFDKFLIFQNKNKIYSYTDLVVSQLNEGNENIELLKPLLNDDDIALTLFKNNKLIYNNKDTNLTLIKNSNYFYIKPFNNNRDIISITKYELNGNIYYIQLIKSYKRELNYLTALVFIILVIYVFTFFSTIILGARTSRKILKPIKIMTDTVKKISISELDKRVDLKGSQDELKDLAKTFNNLLDKIKVFYEKQTNFVSDASHELRTPIAVIQGYANMLNRWGKDDKEVLNESIAAINEESHNMKNLVENLLFLARSDKNTQIVEMDYFYINNLIDELIKETRLIDTHHQIINNFNQEIMIFGDYKLIKEALRIFIDNSLKYTKSGGFIDINLLKKNNKAIISIEDNGVGIDKEDLPHIFDRFYRADKSRTKEKRGTGLGLSIAKWIILKHKGSIEVQSTVNKGTKINIFLEIKIKEAN